MHNYVFFFEIGSFSILLSISIQMVVNSIGKQGLPIGNPVVMSVKLSLGKCLHNTKKQNLYTNVTTLDPIDLVVCLLKTNSTELHSMDRV